MIEISLIIKQNNKTLYTFNIDKQCRFIIKNHNGNESIILENATGEYDGICDDDGRMHFLIQTLDGSLIYIKYDSSEWKKYIVFKSKSQNAKITDIKLTWDKGVLCGFYSMEHKTKNLLVKHIFSASNLYATPEVIDTLDSRKSYCLCTNRENRNVLYYKNESGNCYYKIFDNFFSCIKTSTVDIDKNIFNFSCVCNGSNTYLVYTTTRKGYTALVLRTEKSEEKILTFALAKNSKPSIVACGEYILVQWEEGNTIMNCESNNGGISFEKPKVYNGSSSRNIYREKGVKPGLYFSGASASDMMGLSYYENIVTNNFEVKKNKERKQNMNSQLHKPDDKNIFKEIDSLQFISKLTLIENEIQKIASDTQHICIFLDELVKFKKGIDNNIVSQREQNEETNAEFLENHKTPSDIGEQNEENIKLFEKMKIEDVLPESTYKHETPEGV